MAEKLYSYADKQVMGEVGSGGGGGGGSGALIVHLDDSYDELTVDKTLDEIIEATNNGRAVMLFNLDGDFVGYLTSTDGGVAFFTYSFVSNDSSVRVATVVVTPNTVTISNARLS